MALISHLYNAVGVPAMTFGFRLVALRNSKVREALVGRRHWDGYLAAQLERARVLPHTAWFHCTSVGEFEQARPLIERMYDKMRIILTYFSPSVAPNVRRYPKADAHSYLPLDSRRNMRKLFDLVQPDLLIFSKFDIWPNCVWEASKRHIPVALIAGTLHAQSRRLWPIARGFFREVHRSIALHCVISEADAARFLELCPYPERILVTGDTRFDRVYERALSVSEAAQFFPGQTTLRPPIMVAGSTYLEEETVLFEALKRVHEAGIRPTLILVPHEPTSSRLREIAQLISTYGFSAVYYTQLSEKVDLGHTDVLIIDTVGLLAKLYRLGDVAFVGGSFHGSVHNVMEPAAMAKPLLFGPTVQNAYEANLLQERGAAVQVSDAVSLAQAWLYWMQRPAEASERGRVARAVIEENLGATVKTLEALRALAPYF